MSGLTYAISWNTRDRNLIHKVCSYLRVQPYVSINRTTRVGSLNSEQLQALQSLIQNGSIQLYKFEDK